MTLYPDIQTKAREEIHSKIGTERLPILEDKPSLPYIEAMVKEVLRWNSIAPLGDCDLNLHLIHIRLRPYCS